MSKSRFVCMRVRCSAVVSRLEGDGHVVVHEPLSPRRLHASLSPVPRVLFPPFLIFIFSFEGTLSRFISFRLLLSSTFESFCSTDPDTHSVRYESIQTFRQKSIQEYSSKKVIKKLS